MFSIALTVLPLVLGQQPVAPAPPAPAVAVLVSTRGDNAVRLFSADLKEIARLDAGLGAHELAVSPNGRWALGSAYGGPGQGHQPADNRLVVLDLKTGAIHKTITFPDHKRPNDIAFLPGAGVAIVTLEMPPALARVDAEAGTFAILPVAAKANHMMALSPDGAAAYIAHVMPGSVTIMNLADGKELATISTPPGAEGIACAPNGKSVWVACNRADKLIVIDADARAVKQTIDLPGFPFRVRISPDGKTVAVSLPKSGELALIDPAKPAEPRRIVLSPHSPDPADAPAPADGKPIPKPAKLVPTSIAFTADGAHIVAMCDGPSPHLVKVRIADGAVTHREPITGPIPDALACTPAAAAPTSAPPAR
ncbi:MAG TPA: YncE family protein [Phycisphaerales bacterium]|nr:YncE family protein [Phycisphaerales bacterium]